LMVMYCTRWDRVVYDDGVSVPADAIRWVRTRRCSGTSCGQIYRKFEAFGRESDNATHTAHKHRFRADLLR